jgi:DNA (cytosine-5)-methyltransferase 1
MLHDRTHIEFFAGVGGVSVGLPQWDTTWANDFCPMKAEYYAKNHGDHLVCEDINHLMADDIPLASLVSGTYPCTNTSCAGDRTGLFGVTSGVVYQWIKLLRAKGGADAYPFAMLENPTGLLARNKGADMRSLISTLNSLGYSVCLVVVDAFHFVPQSRPRIFINGIKKSLAHRHMQAITPTATLPTCKHLYTAPLRKWLANNSDLDLVYGKTPPLPVRTVHLEQVIDWQDNTSDAWADRAFTQALVDNLTGGQRRRFDQLLRSPAITIASVARRGRTRADGSRFNATEISVSGLAPAQRPYKGGSSRCWILIAGQGRYRFKCVTPRESARLMGFPDSFILPTNAKQAYQCTGDSVVPQAVAWVENAIYSRFIDENKQHQRPTLQMSQLSLSL